MNLAFAILVILGAVALWFLSSFVFYPLGRFIYRIWENVIGKINKNNESEEKEDER